MNLISGHLKYVHIGCSVPAIMQETTDFIITQSRQFLNVKTLPASDVFVRSLATKNL